MQLSCNWVLKCKSISGIASQPTLENTTEHLFFPPASRSSWTVPSPWGSRDAEPRLDFWAGDPRHVAAEVWRDSWRQHYCVDRIFVQWKITFGKTLMCFGCQASGHGSVNPGCKGTTSWNTGDVWPLDPLRWRRYQAFSDGSDASSASLAPTPGAERSRLEQCRHHLHSPYSAGGTIPWPPTEPEVWQLHSRIEKGT